MTIGLLKLPAPELTDPASVRLNQIAADLNFKKLDLQGDYEEGSFPVTLAGCTTVPSGTAKFVRIGKEVTVLIPAAFNGVSNANGLRINGFPTALIPPSNSCFNVGLLYDNGVPVYNNIGLWTGSFLTFLKSDGTGFTNTGLKGTQTYGFHMRYTLQ